MNPRTKEFKDYYTILSVPEKATDAEIKKSYRKLALENHPDHHPDDPKSEDRFKEITEAYGVLIDPVKRREYNLFRAATLSGSGPGPNPFSYSQQDIFENMFRQGFSRDIFEELNREFAKSGVRSGNPFFQSMLFGGALGGLTRILGMIPGPLGKIGHGIRIAQMVGSSLMAYNQMRQAQKKTSPTGKGEPSHDILDSVKGILKKGVSTLAAPGKDSMNINLSITLPAVEALNGTRKKISYKAGKETEQLVVRIPSNFPPDGKLRIPAKGNIKNGERGDLILTVKIQS
ncbi:MAG: DnaJ domain-containing protein [Nitrospinae bacterium]|jgi:DnaJ-class molecular chaperone|nr:DnaJ domain-containing protein [Nitrospinota bacterium]MDA1110618.1 DnaJ domain-containing protein [Nitrospinota bacterium]